MEMLIMEIGKIIKRIIKLKLFYYKILFLDILYLKKEMDMEF
jgi:hypothetical protein